MPMGEAGATFLGIEQVINGMPVTIKGRRPVIGVDNMNDFSPPYAREPTVVTARAVDGPYRIGSPAVRLAFSIPEKGVAPYGPPISQGVDFGIQPGEEGEPVYAAFGVVVERGKVPDQIEAKRVDGEWEKFDRYRPAHFQRAQPLPNRPVPSSYKGYEALLLGGVLRKVIGRKGEPRQIFAPEPSDG